MAHTVMVTGADGFIGSHLTEELVKRGEKVRAFCLYNSFGSLGWIDTLPPEIRSEIDIFMGDVRDPNGVRTAMRGQERVFHLAALLLPQPGQLRGHQHQGHAERAERRA